MKGCSVKAAGLTAVASLFCLMVSAAEKPEPSRIRMTAGVGRGRDSMDAVRLGWQLDFKKNWFESQTGRLTGFQEISLNYWEKDEDEVWGLFYAPVLVYQFGDEAARMTPYLEAGIGAGLISETDLGERKLSTAFQFEDRLGAGVRFGAERAQDLNLRYVHVSNAGVKEPNDGIDVVVLSYGHTF
jgi:lipid A 3-O-deacylase